MGNPSEFSCVVVLRRADLLFAAGRVKSQVVV